MNTLLMEVSKIRVTSKGQVTIPLDVWKTMGILPAETEVEFLQNKMGTGILPMLKIR